MTTASNIGIGATNITTVGALTAGSLASGFTVVSPALGGTGVNNGTSTFTIGGNFAMSGAFTFTGTITGNTAVTFPTSGTLATTGGASIPTIAQGDTLYGSAPNVLSTLAKDTNATRYLSNTGLSNDPAWAQVALTTGVSGVLPSANGGTGVNNGTSTLTLAGNLATSGAFASTFTMTNTTTVTFPTSGTLATTSQIPSLPLSLANGGTNANLTANNGGIVWSNASQLQILAGTATAGQMLQSGATATPAWSTPTYPSASGTAGKILRSDGTNNVYSTSTFADTYSASNLLYSNGANTVTGLATANRAVLTTGATGVPALTALATDGQLIIGSTAGAPAAATLTAGTNVTITNASNSITISATAGSGTIVQVVQGTLTSTASNSSSTFADTGLSVTITPSANTHKVLIICSINGGADPAANNAPFFNLVRGASTNIFVGDAAGSRTSCTIEASASSATIMSSTSIVYLDSPATTSATTYKIQFAAPNNAAAVYVNRSASDINSAIYARGASSIIAMEVVA